MIRSVLIGLGLLLLGLPFANAQALDPQLRDEIIATQQLLEAKHRGFVARNLPLTTEQREAFWPLYQQFIQAKRETNRLMWQLLVEYAQAYNRDQVDDQLAARLLETSMQLREQQQQLWLRFLPQFKQVLPLVKVARFYQVDSRMDAIMRVEIGQKVPLIEQ